MICGYAVLSVLNFLALMIFLYKTCTSVIFIACSYDILEERRVFDVAHHGGHSLRIRAYSTGGLVFIMRVGILYMSSQNKCCQI